jgi:hypothetical protein
MRVIRKCIEGGDHLENMGVDWSVVLVAVREI